MKPQLREVTNSPDCSFKVKVFEGSEFPAAWHFHPQYELTYMVKSTGIRYVGDSMQAFEPGDLVLVGRDLPHSWKTIDSKSDGVHCVIIQWDDSLLRDWLTKPEFAAIKNMLAYAPKGISFDKETALNLEGSFLALKDQSPFERLLSFLSILHTLALNSNFTLLAGPGFGKFLSPKDSHRVNLIHNYIKETVHQTCSLNDVSGQLAISKEAFCRYFKKTFGKTFSHYVNEYKITLASKMLIETDYSVSEIGFCVGFNNLSFFHRQFNRYRGMSPKSYRMAYRKI